MSIKWMAIVWEDAKDVEGTELLVLLSIADHASDTGSAFPSVRRLCERSRRAERTVQEALASLEEKGWLVRTPRSGRSTIYQITTPAVDRTPADSAPPQPTAPLPRSEPHPSPAVDRTHNHQGTTSESGGAVEEVSTEQQQQDSADDAVPRHGTDGDDVEETIPPFPWWARNHHLMTGADVVTQNHWLRAWRTICVQKDTSWTATDHLTLYLARCVELKKKPNPDEWIRWFAQDEQKAQQELRLRREQAGLKDRPGNPDFQ